MSQSSLDFWSSRLWLGHKLIAQFHDADMFPLVFRLVFSPQVAERIKTRHRIGLAESVNCPVNKRSSRCECCIFRITDLQKFNDFFCVSGGNFQSLKLLPCNHILTTLCRRERTKYFRCCTCSSRIFFASISSLALAKRACAS